MKKVKEMFYLSKDERTSDYSRGYLLVLEDGTKIELMSTDVVGDKIEEVKEEVMFTREQSKAILERIPRFYFADFTGMKDLLVKMRDLVEFVRSHTSKDDQS